MATTKHTACTHPRAATPTPLPLLIGDATAKPGSPTLESEHPAPPGSDSFRLPADNYHELQQIHDQLLLHARCIAPITHQEDDATLDLTRNMLADCFQQLAQRLARALEPDGDEPGD